MVQRCYYHTHFALLTRLKGQVLLRLQKEREKESLENTVPVKKIRRHNEHMHFTIEPFSYVHVC
jgi:hypothetical protein